jgi:hypothetical protein
MAAPTTMMLSVGAAFAVGVALTASLMVPHSKTGTAATGPSQVKSTADAADRLARSASPQAASREWSDPKKPVVSDLQKPVVSELTTSGPTHASSVPPLVFNDSDSPEPSKQQPTTLAERPKVPRSAERSPTEPSLRGAPSVKTSTIPTVRPRSVVASMERLRVEPRNSTRRKAEQVGSQRALIASQADETSDRSRIDRKRVPQPRDQYAFEANRERYRRPSVVPLPVHLIERRDERYASDGYRAASYPDHGYVYADAGRSAENDAPYMRQHVLRADEEPIISRRAPAQTGVMRWLQEPIAR